MIEEVTKSVRRKQTVDAEYIENLYAKMETLYHLDSIGPQDYEKQDLGEYPAVSVALLVSLGTIWLVIGAYFLYGLIKKRRK